MRSKRQNGQRQVAPSSIILPFVFPASGFAFFPISTRSFHHGLPARETARKRFSARTPSVYTEGSRVGTLLLTQPAFTPRRAGPHATRLACARRPVAAKVRNPASFWRRDLCGGRYGCYNSDIPNPRRISGRALALPPGHPRCTPFMGSLFFQVTPSTKTTAL